MSGPARGFSAQAEGVSVTRKDIEITRRYMESFLREIPFRLFVRTSLSLDGRLPMGVAFTHFKADGELSASIYLTEKVVKLFVLHANPPEVYVEEDDWKRWWALHIVLHECAHVIQHGTFADLFKKHFAPYGAHEQEQFANALAAAWAGGTRTDQWGTYHPPTYMQMQVLASHLTYRTNRRLRGIHLSGLELVDGP